MSDGDGVRYVGVRDLRNHTAEVVKAVEQGGEAVLTARGKPVARIVPLQPAWRSRSLELLHRDALDTGFGREIADDDALSMDDLA